MRRSFSLLELIFMVFIISIITINLNSKVSNNKLIDATNRLVLYLKETRYQSLVDNKINSNSNLWHKKRWTLKFFRCNKNIGGLYYVIYSDKNETGHPGLNESLNDPLTSKKIYSTNKCEESTKRSKYVLLTKEFGITDIDVSCNNTTSIGQISFGQDGKVYSKLSSYEYQEDEYEITKSCKIIIKADKIGYEEIIIEGNTGYIYKREK